MPLPGQTLMIKWKPMILGFFVVLLTAPIVALNGQSQNASPQPNETATSDAAAKGAARRKNYYDLKRQLENGDGKSDSSGTPSTALGLLISPAQVGMLIHDDQKFSLLDIHGHNLKEKAEWSLSNSYVVDLVDGEVPAIIAKDTGTVTLRARLGNLTGEAEIKVYPGDKLPIGTVRWAAPKIPGYTTTQVLQAVPTTGNIQSSPKPKP